MTDWNAIADQWHPTCPQCKEKMDLRIAPEDPRCHNLNCPACDPAFKAWAEQAADWERISRLGGRNQRWPNRWVYCYGSTANTTDEWLTLFCKQAKARGFEVVSGSDPGGTNVYVLGPVGS